LNGRIEQGSSDAQRYAELLAILLTAADRAIAAAAARLGAVMFLFCRPRFFRDRWGQIQLHVGPGGTRIEKTTDVSTDRG